MEVTHNTTAIPVLKIVMLKVTKKPMATDNYRRIRDIVRLDLQSSRDGIQGFIIRC